MDEDRTYFDVGFDKFLSKRRSIRTEYTEDEASLSIESKTLPFAGGTTSSSNEKMVLDWENNKITIKDGARDRVIVGYISEENKFGVRVIDSTGTTRLDEMY